MPSIEARIQKIVVEQLCVKPEQVTPDARFDDALGADSLDVLELVIGFEEEFECEISDSDVETLLTPADVANYFRQHGITDTP